MSAFRAISRPFKSLPFSIPQRSDPPIFRIKSLKTLMGSSNPRKRINPSLKVSIFNHLENHRLDQAQNLFDQMPSPDINLCTMMISGYTRKGRLAEALDLFDRMPERDTISWNSMLKGCVECGDLRTAVRLFDEMPERNVVSWTTMVNGYFKSGKVNEAERLFDRMPVRDVAAWNSMVHGYLQFGRVEDAMKTFKRMPLKNVISWTSMIGGLDGNGKSEEALSLFEKMLGSGVEPTSSSFACVVTACANVFAFRLGTQVHGCIFKKGLCFDEFICASLITFYAECKRVEDSCKLFWEKSQKNVVIWTALLTGYGLNCKHKEALSTFAAMLKISVFPNQSTFSSALNSCCELEALDQGKEIHGVAIKLGLETDVFVGNSLVVMYTECGNVNDALAVFKRISEKNIVSWNSIIVGCAQHGCGMLALTIFCKMVRANIKLDEITFTGLLSACSHCGFLQKGKKLFGYMTRKNIIEVKIQHYACMVDILGRCGKLEEAEELIRRMPMKPTSMIWSALLSASRIHSDIDRAERAAQHIFDIDPNFSAAYVLLSNLYASSGKWIDVSRMRVDMKRRGIVKQPGSSWIVLKGCRHEFRSGDRSHPLSENIYQKLDWIRVKLKEIGHVPDERFALHDVEDEQKEEMLWYHSERLAIAFSLITTVEGSTITVMKNLRVCGDCHSAIKLIAKIVGREIVVRDSSRFHHFKNGRCSCGDYW